MLSGLKAFGNWAKTHWVWALILFLVVIPFILLGLFASVRNKLASLPVIGGYLAQIPSIGGTAT